jgi:hypothetical protein
VPGSAARRPRLGGSFGSNRDARNDVAGLNEASRRAAILARRHIGPGSVVAISHSGSAHFFADLFAVWAVGAAAACLDDALTDFELQTVLDFIKPAAFLINRANISNTHGVPTLDLTSGHPPERWAGSTQIANLARACLLPIGCRVQHHQCRHNMQNRETYCPSSPTLFCLESFTRGKLIFHCCVSEMWPRCRESSFGY